MLRYFVKKDGATIVHDVFRKYVESYRQYLKVAQRRAIELFPDRKLAWQNAFRLQHLLKEREALRFEYLFGRNKFDGVDLRSLSSIAARLDNGWSEAEEAEIKENLSVYTSVAREIEDIQSKWDADALGDSSRVVDQDLKYCDARRALAERTRKLEAQLVANRL
jgi:hypothetical protein